MPVTQRLTVTPKSLERLFADEVAEVLLESRSRFTEVSDEDVDLTISVTQEATDRYAFALRATRRGSYGSSAMTVSMSVDADRAHALAAGVAHSGSPWRQLIDSVVGFMAEEPARRHRSLGEIGASMSAEAAEDLLRSREPQVADD